MAEQQIQDITKLDAAIGQLVTAIRLFFEDQDPISIHSLASNAREILDVLATNKGADRMVDFIVETTGQELKAIYRSANRNRNFFKHADKDPTAKIRGFSDKDNDSILFIACHDLLTAQRKSPVEVQVFVLWFMAANPDKLLPESEEERAAIEKHFPNLACLPRKLQKNWGWAHLEYWSQDEWLLAQPETDTAR